MASKPTPYAVQVELYFRLEGNEQDVLDLAQRIYKAADKEIAKAGGMGFVPNVKTKPAIIRQEP